MEKILDLRKSVYELCSKDSEIPIILDELGFHDILKPGMLNTMGRFMTIPKGAKLKKIDIEDIKFKFEEKGYKVTVG